VTAKRVPKTTRRTYKRVLPGLSYLVELKPEEKRKKYKKQKWEAAPLQK
jgi:hypothetical protein